MNGIRKIWAVIGGGNGGQTFAGHLALQGENVRLFTKSIDKVNKIAKKNKIILKNAITEREI